MSHLLAHNPVFESDGQLLTTSLEIADGTYLQHKNVLELIESHLSDFKEFGLVAFETRARPAGQHGGGDIQYVNLNEQQATLLLTYMRNSDIVRAFKKRLVRAFYELRFREPQNRPADFLNDPAQLRQVLLGYTEKVIALEATVADQAPKVAALEAISDAPDMFCMRDAAKHLGWNPHVLVTWLATERWIFRNNAQQRWVAYQPPIEAGWLEHKIVTIGEDRDGTPKTVPQVMVTSKGLARIAVVFEKQRVQRTATAQQQPTTCH